MNILVGGCKIGLYFRVSSMSLWYFLMRKVQNRNIIFLGLPDIPDIFGG